MEIKDWIRTARKHGQLTQEQLGERLGVTKANVSGWENGRHEASFTQLTAISRLTGQPLPGNWQSSPESHEPVSSRYFDLAHQAEHDGVLRDVLDKFIEGGSKAVTIAWTALLLAEDNEKSARAKPSGGHKKAASGGTK